MNVDLDPNQLKATLQRELDALTRTAEELRVQARLARAELATEWDRLEKRLRASQEEINRVGEHAKGPLQDIEKAVRALFGEIKQGFERLRKLD